MVTPFLLFSLTVLSISQFKELYLFLINDYRNQQWPQVLPENEISTIYIQDTVIRRLEMMKTMPFKLSETKKKPDPLPPPKPELYKGKPVPTNPNKKTLQQLEKENKQRLEQNKKKVIETQKEAKPFDYKTDSHPTDYETVKKEGHKIWRLLKSN